MVSTQEPSAIKRDLQQKIDNYWHETSCVTNEERSDKMRSFLLQAKKYLEADQIAESFDCYYQAKRQYNLARKYRQIYYWRSWVGMQIAIVLLILFSSGVLALWFWQDRFLLNTIAPFIASLGGGVGGATAVLIQVIDVNPNSEAISKWPWYMIKPILGAALGFITYFVVVSSLNIITNGARIDNFEGIVIIGFLAGFFESFSTGILARVAGQFADSRVKDVIIEDNRTIES